MAGVATPGTVVDDRYQLGPRIGRGAMGEVFRAEDARLRRPVAIKVLRADLVAEPGPRARFANEARAAARINHPSAVTVYDSGTWDGVPYLAMECLPGTTLSDEIAQGPLPESKVRSIALDIAGALQAAHDLGIVHRDVKPGNILMTEDGRAKLGDFGIAWSADRADQTQTGLVIGTPAYLAPERLVGEPATIATDLYSLAVVLYEALVGDRPFRGDSPAALVHSIYNGDRSALGDVRPGTDPALAAAVDQALARDPADRPSSAAEFAQLIRRATPAAEAPTVAVSLPATAVFEATRPADTVDPDDQPALPPPSSSGPPPSASAASASADPRRRAATDFPVGWIIAALVVTLLLVAGIVVAVTLGRDDGATTPTTTSVPAASTEPTPSTTLPAPLDDALDDLEGTVQR